MIQKLFLCKNKHYIVIVLKPNFHLYARSFSFFLAFFFTFMENLFKKHPIPIWILLQTNQQHAQLLISSFALVDFFDSFLKSALGFKFMLPCYDFIVHIRCTLYIYGRTQECNLNSSQNWCWTLDICFSLIQLCRKFLIFGRWGRKNQSSWNW